MKNRTLLPFFPGDSKPVVILTCQSKFYHKILQIGHVTFRRFWPRVYSNTCDPIMFCTKTSSSSWAINKKSIILGQGWKPFILLFWISISSLFYTSTLTHTHTALLYNFRGDRIKLSKYHSEMCSLSVICNYKLVPNQPTATSPFSIILVGFIFATIRKHYGGELKTFSVLKDFNVFFKFDF